MTSLHQKSIPPSHQTTQWGNSVLDGDALGHSLHMTISNPYILLVIMF